jgi:histidine triad (HIT) family protein
MASECIFCKLSQGEIPSDKIYENKHLVSILDIKPVSPGHALVIPKQHFKTILDVPQELLCEMMQVTQKIAKEIIAVTKAHGFNIIVNSGRAAEQLIDHVHIHIIPRSMGDNIRYTHKPIQYKEGEKEDILERIKKVLKQ